MAVLVAQRLLKSTLYSFLNLKMNTSTAGRPQVICLPGHSVTTNLTKRACPFSVPPAFLMSKISLVLCEVAALLHRSLKFGAFGKI